MCDVCNGNLFMTKEIDINSGLEMSIKIKGDIMTQYINGEPLNNWVGTKILYCPICGVKLSKLGTK